MAAVTNFSSSPSSSYSCTWRSSLSPIVSFLSQPYESLTTRIRTTTGRRRRRRSSFTVSSPRALLLDSIRSSSPMAITINPGSRKRIYERKESCVVVPPPPGTKPRAIIHFLGGAFVGAVPEVTYSYLMEMLSKEGFLLISVPYNVTFDHAKAARQVFQGFHHCLDLLLADGFNYSVGPQHVSLSSQDLCDLPVFSVGHSNGALLQLLIGSYFSDRLPQANAVLSFNNRPASEAVPFFDQFGPIYSQMMPIVEQSPLHSIGTIASGNALKILQDTALALDPYDQEARISIIRFFDQIPSVFYQVREGLSEFTPTPTENRETFGKSYNVSNTLLVKFNSDAIDETDLAEEVLQARVKSFGGTLEKVTLSGNHLTPCIQDLKWQVGRLYTPTDAVVQALKSISLIETKALTRTITDWLCRFIVRE